MVKRILSGGLLALALTIVGCGGSTNGSGTAYVYGVNADPNVGSVTITANGTAVLTNAGYGASSSGYTTVSGGANAQVYVTNASGQQLAGTTFISGFVGGNSYSIFAWGNSANQSVAIFPIDVSVPATGLCRLMFTNTSVYQPSVDVYVTTQTSPAGLTPNRSGLGPFNSGFTSEVNNITPGTYNIIFTQAGTQTILASQTGLTVGTTLSGTGANAITLVGITDSQGTTVPALQQTITPIVFNAVSGAAPPSMNAKPIVISGSKVKA